ncbi:MAG: hypothetical protein GY801_13400 [bacterium]|nr:hypothetical protein [bacterium]
MWIVKLVTFIEYHPLPALCVLLVFLGLIWLIRREVKRPSYRQRNDLERLLNGFEPPAQLGGEAEEEQ